MSDEFFESRPVSRRGTKIQTQTPMADASRPPTAMRPSSRMRPPSTLTQRAPPTAARLTTGLVAPKTGMMNIADRPITQQGLAGLRTGTARAQQRQVLDKRYYEGLLRLKMKDITNEIRLLSAEIHTQRQHEATSDVYERRVKEVATELTALQGQLADLNQVVDHVHTGSDVSHVIEETEEVKIENLREAAKLEQLLQENYNMEHQISRIENEIENEKNQTKRLIDEMEPEMREKYELLTSTNSQLLMQISDQQQQLDYFKSQTALLEDKISTSQIKQDAMHLYQKLREREERKSQLEEEAKSKATPAQEREQLLQRVREDNAEMAAMERQMSQISEQIEARKAEMTQVEQDLEDINSDRHQKFKELKRRGETMEQFLSTFEENRNMELERIEQQENKIEIALQQMTRNIVGVGTLPSQDEFAAMKETLIMKQGELENSKLTVSELSKEESKLQVNLKKVEQLEEKITTEISNLREKLLEMKKDIEVFADLDSLRNEAQAKRNTLMSRKKALEGREIPAERLEELRSRHQELQKQLNENDTYVQLHSLEKKLEVLQQGNENMKQSITTKTSDLDYSAVKTEALNLIQLCNKKLMKGSSNKFP